MVLLECRKLHHLTERNKVMTVTEKLKCNVINIYGNGQHPCASESTIEYFNTDYVLECIDKAIAIKYNSIDELKKLKEKA